ncbi:site-specific integrase [Zobellia laminariae]|uniref:site-specific integrase n=1 Tax=Zobellia laminariae TaxID=248906 RepID=UPI0012D97EEB|nr:site-specific integrase [Zobellia laminariae]
MLENSRLSVVFVVRKLTSKIDTIKIYARVTVDGKRAEFNLNRELSVSLWDEKRKRGKGFSKYVISLNKYMDQVFTGLHEAHRQLLQQGVDITSAGVKARYLGKDERGKTLLDLISYHNTTMSSVLRRGTMKNYYSTERCIKEFLKEEKGVEDIPLKKLNYGFIVDFEQYIRKYKPATRMGCANNGTMKHMERQFLRERELQLIEETTFKVSSTQHIKDLFIFACYTGLSFIDVQELKSDHLVKGMDGNDWLYTKRTKTDEPLKIPLLPKAKEIIDKYKDDPDLFENGRLLPMYSNPMINRTLKDIAKVCGIRKKVTFHVARHTFATAITLSNGVPIETVSKLLGHTKLSTTQIYARVVENKVGEDMQNLMDTMKLRKDKQVITKVVR